MIAKLETVKLWEAAAAAHSALAICVHTVITYASFIKQALVIGPLPLLKIEPIKSLS